MVSLPLLPQTFEESKVFWKKKKKDEKQERPDKAGDRKKYDKRYENSDKAKARKKRYREKNQSEISKKRKEQEKIKREREKEAFCRHFNLDVWIFRGLEKAKENGIDIWAREPRYAKFIQIFQTGVYPEDMRVTMVATRKTVPGTDQFHLPKQDEPWRVLQAWNRRNNPSVKSIDYW